MLQAANRPLELKSLHELNSAIVDCRRCPRLVPLAGSVRENPPRRFLGNDYWAKPLPGFWRPNGPRVDRWACSGSPRWKIARVECLPATVAAIGSMGRSIALALRVSLL